MGDARPGRPSLRPRTSATAVAGGPDAALETARRALEPLRAVRPVDRGRALVAVAADVEDRRAQFVDAVRRAGGGRFSEAVGAVDGLVDDTVRWAGWADKLDLLVPGGTTGTRGPGVVAVLPAGDLRDVAGAVFAVLLTGGTCVVVDDSRPVGLLVDALAARFPAGSVQVVPAPDADLPVRSTPSGPATDADRVLDLLDRVAVTGPAGR